ncbi:MAG: hypothetical protein U9R17_06370 [Thermodesulfobacteriota bacterium]|nr:hypothetical protein [Thermodesulfobacteriota bacterium]
MHCKIILKEKSRTFTGQTYTFYKIWVKHLNIKVTINRFRLARHHNRSGKAGGFVGM